MVGGVIAGCVVDADDWTTVITGKGNVDEIAGLDEGTIV